MPSNDGGREKEVEEQAENKLELLNRSMISKATQIVSDNKPASDLWPQFRQALSDYKRRRTDILDSQNPKPEPSGEDPRCGSDSKPKAGLERHDSFKHKIPDEDIYTPWPLSSALQNSLQITAVATGDVIQNEQASMLRSILSTLLIQGELLYQYATRTVVRIFSDMVVKINKSKDQTETHVLHHIHKHTQRIPAPRPLGMMVIGIWSYTFTSFIPGIPLDRIWGNLTPAKKSYVREQLNHIFTELRRLPGPSSEGYLGGGTPPVCKGGHRFRKTSSSPIVSEAQFNDFLLEDSWLQPARVDHIHRSLPNGHRIVMTHGDLCPPNIIVESEDRQRITGIVDWDTGGAYPEYWEYVNAFKSSLGTRDDWRLYLPKAGIGRYFNEYARYSVIGRFARE
ncbi:kinase-like domain-containing protein [Lineolata rhizophorae]|uniref:Kinase-like domain-containing protein n=1 Tax=Lineolata rhizophorae TaxID=578093 RepID=A0A6A6NPE6_9PEZI|nr:kinase-like domain-containing protein [Lineolata rhizophorae]